MTLDCSFTLNFNYYVMYWYHQPPNGKMTEVISMFSDSSSNMEGRYTLSLLKRSRILKLTITGLMPADTGVYFCAIGENLHSEKSDREGLTKTPWAQHETATCSRSIGENNPQDRKRVDRRHGGWHWCV